MSEKNEKKFTWDASSILWACAVVCLIAAVAVVIWQFLPEKPQRPQPEITIPVSSEPLAGESEPVFTEPLITEALPTEPKGLDVGDGILVEEVLSYSGTFLEDRTDEEVENVLAIRVKNTGEKYIQTMDIVLSDGETQARFSLSTLFPGETIIVPEQGRMAFAGAPEFTSASAENVALFDADPGMCEDRVRVQCLSGVMNITNISGEEIPGDIFVYYKNYADGVYYGGITYRVRISGGMKAGEIRQGSAAHFDPDTSKVVFVTCG